MTTYSGQAHLGEQCMWGIHERRGVAPILPSVRPNNLNREQNVLERRPPRQQAGILECPPDDLDRTPDFLLIDDDASGAGRDKAGDELHQRDRKSTRLNSSHVSESRMPS